MGIELKEMLKEKKGKGKGNGGTWILGWSFMNCSCKVPEPWSMATLGSFHNRM
jgi:hypothetical protein